VDRLAVLADRVLLADYKTNRAPPARLDDVPLLYLRQMAAYRAVLRAIHPGREVSCALVWTAGARVMQLPGPLLDRHAPGAPQPA
jgi:ATP-dependent helicase/nuclease subunit A